MFSDRIEAGKKLAERMQKLKNQKDTLILGLPRGGVVIAAEVAKALHLPLDVTCPRKIGAPHNPEYAIGAITETGQGIFDEEAIVSLGVSQKYLDQEVARQKQIAENRLKLFRKDLPPRNLKNKTVILIDDGLATGSTMKAAIESVKFEGAKAIVVAIPVAPVSTLQEMEPLVDQIICLSSPPLFYAIGQFYEEFPQVDDEEVVELLKSIANT